VILDPRILCILDFYTFEKKLVLDFLTYSHTSGDLAQDREFVFQQLKWAEVEDGILYVSTAHRTYAESSGGLNAYITAIDLETLGIIWRSRPLVSNSENFIVAGDMIITGYGFTAEDDFIYLLNRLTGEVAETYNVPSAPDYLFIEEEKLYVRCYDSDCVFQIQR
jgi:outer membrane protein assembly factor BamB